MFTEALSEAQLSAWQSLNSVVRNFLRNHRSTEYEKDIQERMKKFCQLRAWMSVKLHFLCLHLGNFPKNLGDLCEELCEPFHQDICIMEVRCQGWRDVNFHADYC